MTVIDTGRRQTEDVWRLTSACVAWVLFVTLIATTVALLVTLQQTRMYTSTVKLVVENRVYLSGAPAQEPDMGSERQIATSGTVAAIIARNLNLSDVSELQDGLSVSVPVDTNVLVISYTHPDPATAQERADAFAGGYLEYLETRNERVIAAAEGTGRTADIGLQAAEIITPATLPRSPSSPNLVVNVGVAAIAGLGLGVATALLRERFSDRLRGANDFEARTALPVLAVVPAARRAERDVTSLVSVAEPRSSSARAYRALRAKLMQLAESRGAKTIAVTSSVDEHGTMLTATNLAVGLAEAGKDIVLVCGNLERPRLHIAFGLDNDVGLTSVVHGGVPLDDALRKTSVDRLFLLSAGPPTAESRQRHATASYRQVLARLADYADFVVIDAPPVLLSEDIPAFADFVDMVLLVEGVQRSKRRELDAATVELDRVRDKLVGGVLTVNPFSCNGLRDKRIAPSAPPGSEQVTHASRPPSVSMNEPNPR